MDESIQAYIAQQEKPTQHDLIRVYQVIREILPNEQERINWGMPTFGANIIHFAAAKRHVGIYPGPEAVEHFAPQLDERGFKHSKGAIQMPYGKVDLDLIAEITRWCRAHRQN